MLRAVVAKRVIDRLIREKLKESCAASVVAEPIVWRRRTSVECNWEIPGWSGAPSAVTACHVKVDAYLRLLESQFDIPDEMTGEA
jgi:hypothetical protein